MFNKIDDDNSGVIEKSELKSFIILLVGSWNFKFEYVGIYYNLNYLT